ncbi:MAG TPA: ATP phosphoribosyltransferase regulatory subunit [Polyangia bacterium]|jgi:ATP phosphoribosyltransferase regulatory subunit
MNNGPQLRLPTGMRDFAPAAAASRRRIAETLLGVFERWGFARVITPAFEYEDVLALGLGEAGRAAAIRFVEPSSGQVVALRPDITPQIARLIATRYRDEGGAIRLCYEGTVVRLERGARGQRELIQAGVELAGVAGPHGDAEMIALGAAALQAAGLGTPTIDLGHLGLAREVLDAVDLPDGAREEARLCIGKRDGAGLEEILRAARGPKSASAFAALLPSLSGPPSILADARKRAPTAGIKRALAQLQAIVDAVAARTFDARVHVDLGEVRGFDYYTGVRVQGFVAGAPDAVLAGGRYDDLLGRYGRPSPAVGFAIDVEAAAAALDARAQQENGGATDGGNVNLNGNGGVLVVGPVAAAQRLANELRAKGKRAAAEPCGLRGDELDAYAKRWGFGAVVHTDSALAPSPRQLQKKKKEP